MKNIAAMKQEKTKVVEEVRALLDKAEAESRGLTEEETALYNERMETIEKKVAEIEREETLQRHELQSIKVEQVEREQRYGEFRSLAEFIAAVRFNPADPRLVEHRYEEETPLAQQGDNVQGGYLVPPQYSGEILQVGPEDAVVRPRARVIPAGFPPDATYHLPALDQTTYGMYGGVEVEWIDEGGEKPASKPKFDRVSLEPHEVAGTINVTDKLLRNTTSFDPLARRLLRESVIAAEEVAFLSGTGVGQPTGFIGHASNILVARADAGDITYADLVNMYAVQLMGGRYVWVASQTVLPRLMSMEDTEGHLVWQPNARDGAPGTLLGHPCLITGRTPTLGNQGDLCLCDFAYYLIKDGSGIFIDASPHFRFTENITVIKITWNVDGTPWPSAPFTLEDGTTEVSPFVVLDEAEGS